MTKTKTRGPRTPRSAIDPLAPANMIIAKFGGLAEMSRKTGIPTSSIFTAAKSGHFSPKRWEPIKAAGLSHKIKLSDADFSKRGTA